MGEGGGVIRYIRDKKRGCLKGKTNDLDLI
jgi:hypothetical protein